MSIYTLIDGTSSRERVLPAHLPQRNQQLAVRLAPEPQPKVLPPNRHLFLSRSQ